MNWKVIVLTALLVLGYAQNVTAQEPSPEIQKKALELVKEAGLVLYPPDPNGGVPGFEASVVFEGSERRDRAIELYTEALELWPNCVPALVHRCANRGLNGDIEGAKADARRALALQPRPFEYSLLAFPFEGEEAREVLRLGMERVGGDSPAYPGLWGDLAGTYFYEGNFAAQAQELESLCASGKARSYHYSALGMAYEALGQPETAESVYLKSLPETAESLIRLRMQGDPDRALATLQEYKASIEPDDAVVYGALIKALAGRAVPELEEAIEAVKRNGESNIFGVDGFSAGVLLLAQGDTEIARAHLRAFLEMVESNPKEWGVTMRWRVKKAKELLD